MYYQHDVTTPHFTRNVTQYLNEQFPYKRFGVFMAVKTEVMVFWDVVPGSVAV
jgi:hypothetical protein